MSYVFHAIYNITIDTIIKSKFIVVLNRITVPVKYLVLARSDETRYLTKSAPRFSAAQPPRTYASPAPKANENLARAIFYTDCAKVKNGLALGVRVPGRSIGYPTPPLQTRT